MRNVSNEYANLKTEAARVEWMRDFFSRNIHALDRRRKIPQVIDDQCTFDSYELEPGNGTQHKAFNVCKLFAERLAHRLSEGPNGNVGLLMLGLPGCGKTHLAYAILNHVKSTCPGYYVTARELMDFMRERGDESNQVSDRMRGLQSCSVLVIDEIGRSFGTDFERKTLRDIYDARQNRDLPTILITNCDRQELSEVLDDTFVSRLKKLAYDLVFDWDDYRAKTAVGRLKPEDVFAA